MTIRGLTRDCSGTTALEFGIIGNVLMMLLFAGIEIGIMMWTQTTLQVIANQTARCAAVGCCYWAPSTSCVSAATWAVDEANARLWNNVITAASNVTVTIGATTCDSATSTTQGAPTYDKVQITLPYWTSVLKYPIKWGFSQQVVTACYPT